MTDQTGDDGRLLVYGAYGYTGRLVVERARACGLSPVVAGRRREPTTAVADDHGVDARVFALDDRETVADAVADVAVVCNCAGPFVHTAEPLVEACLSTGTDYCDVTGEIGVFETLAGYDDAAREAGVTVLPGVGFDVVPTDALAAHLADRLPSATRLSLGFQGLGSVSPGTAHTVVDSLSAGGAVRRDGHLQSVPLAHDVRWIDFGRGETRAAAIPWGDVSTAYHTTGIENVTVYAAQPGAVSRLLRAGSRLAPLAGAAPVQSLLHGLVDRVVDGPDERDREAGETYVWGRVTDGERTETARLRTPETYRFTAHSAVALADRVADGAPAGFQTPAGAFGPEVVSTVAGVEWVER
ncbi:trans-acting enoyl reductase family protein [Halobaculum sp. MBLA0143]|uniref:saccharopine dehydrogenase family protein n=1 Tax=Halobaculum sp. MBLA0143 TaxID=3079933 RepID=UPI003523BBE5